MSLAVLLAAPVLAAGHGPAAAVPAGGGCPEGAVTVVVDPGPLGGRPRTGCAPDGGDLATRLTAEAGFRLTLVAGQPFVCRVDGLPPADREDCSGTPPGDAYWGLFWAGRGAPRWTYASLGAASLRVPAGGAVGWRFEDGGGLEVPRTGPAAGGPASTPRPAAADPAADAGSGSSVPLTLVAAGCVGVLACAAAVLGRRRRGAAGAAAERGGEGGT